MVEESESRESFDYMCTKQRIDTLSITSHNHSSPSPKSEMVRKQNTFTTATAVHYRVLIMPALMSFMMFWRTVGFFMWSCSAAGLPCACCKMDCMIGSAMIFCQAEHNG